MRTYCVFSVVLILLADIAVGCRPARPQKIANANRVGGHPPVRLGQEREQNEPTNNAVDNWFGGMPEQAKAWTDFVSDSKYQAATSNDFDIPEWALAKWGDDIRTRTSLPIVGGDIKHDGSSTFAVIVIDTTTRGPSNFSIVIFSRTKAGGDYKPHWLCLNQDLSKTIFEWWSGGLEVEQFGQDGSTKSCKIRWDSEQDRYVCDGTLRL